MQKASVDSMLSYSEYLLTNAHLENELGMFLYSVKQGVDILIYPKIQQNILLQVSVKRR